MANSTIPTTTYPTADDGVLNSSTASPAEASYDQSHYPSLFAAEDRHFWFKVRNKVIAALTRQLIAEFQPGYRFLEIGCGNGNVLQELEQVCEGGTVIGIDLFSEGLRFARRRVSSPLIQADIYSTPFKVPFEMIGLFDVLEHLPDDIDVLKQVRTMLPNNGALLITVPAYKSLWSYADHHANHKRRYSRLDLEQKLLEAGFKVEYVTYYMMSIVPLVWLGRMLANRALKRSQNPAELERRMFQNELKIRPGMNQFLFQAISQELHFIERRRQLPFGTSLIALARRI
jgi:SAM-dependent methyltransferase